MSGNYKPIKIKTMNKKEELQAEYENEAVQAYCDAIGAEYLDDFAEAYQGEWADDAEFVQDLLEGCGDIPKDLPAYIYIDWDRTARDVMMDYMEEGGYYFRNL